MTSAREVPTELRHAHDEIVTRHRGLVGRTVLVSALTLLSRVLGFVRESLTAFVFGDGSAISDAFFTAWRVPNLFRRLLGEGALSTSLQTALTEEDASGDPERGRTLFVSTLRVASGILLVLSAVCMLLVAWLPDTMPVTGWHWMGTDPGPVRDLTVRLFPFVLFVCVAALCAGALQVRGHFAAPNVAPTALNVVWIASLIVVGAAFGWTQSAEGPRDVVLARQWQMARWLSWGVLAGGILQLAVHLPALARTGFLRPSVGAAHVVRSARSGWRVLATATPLAIGAAVYQVNVMVDGLMAEGLLADGGPTALYYANRVQQFPLALVALAAVNAVFPSLTAYGQTGRLRELRRLHDRSQHAVLFLALPAAVGLFLLARPIASALFEHGSYGSAGIERIASALRVLAFAILPAGAVGLVGRAYYALGDFKTPVKISIVMLVLNAGLNVFFVRGMGMDVEGLALATMLTAWGNLAWLWRGMGAKLGLPASEGGMLGRVARIVAASAVSGAGALAASAAAAPGGAWGRVAAAAAAGFLLYALAARALRIPEWEELAKRLRSRFS